MLSEYVIASLQMPEGTPVAVTTRHAEHLADMAAQLQEQYIEPNGKPVVQHILTTIGSLGGSSNSSGQPHLALVSFEVIPPEQRESDISTHALVREWQNLIGDQLTGNNFATLNEAGEKVKAKLAEFDGLFDIKNSFEDGKTEVQLRLKPEAEQLGLTMQQLGTQVRQAIYGTEARNNLAPRCGRLFMVQKHRPSSVTSRKSR